MSAFAIPRFFALLIPFGLLELAFAQQPGSLDETFDGDGRLILDQIAGTGAPVVRAMKDRNLLLAFSRMLNGTPGVEVRKLTDDGQPDTTFAEQGVLAIENLGGLFDLLVTQEGGFLVFLKETDAAGFHLRCLRFTVEGLADATYGEGGILHIAPSAGVIDVNDVLLLPDDRLLIAERHSVASSLGVTRWMPNGSMDPTFGINGAYASPNAPMDAQLAIQNMTHIYVAGLRIMRMDWDGQAPLQTLSIGPPEYLGGVVSNNQGIGLLRARQWLNFPGLPYSIGVVRFAYNPELPSGGWGSQFTGLYLQSSYDSIPAGDVHLACSDQAGNFLVASTKTNNASWWVHRIRSYGTTMDSDFANNGTVGTSFSQFQVTPMSMTVQVDGKLVVAGMCFVDGADRVVLARYHNIPDPRTKLSLRMFLGGAYDPATGLMHDSLRRHGLVPAQQPYTLPHFVAGGSVGPWTASPHALQADGPSAVVDWVWIELLSATDSTNVVASRVGLLHRDGWVTAADGDSPLDFDAGTGSYFVRARHRNHLGVTSSQPLALGAWTATLDLTDPSVSTFGADAQMTVNGARALWPGDVNGDGLVKYVGAYNDRDAILTVVGGSTPTAVVAGYHAADVNLDGLTKYVGAANDRDAVLLTLGGDLIGVRAEQRP